MQGIARKSNYTFVGVLQPAAGIGNYKNNWLKDAPEEYVKNYKTYFPQAINYVRQEDTALFDFTGIFDTATAKVFTDDCHLTDPYQKVVAQNMFEAMVKTGCIK